MSKSLKPLRCKLSIDSKNIEKINSEYNKYFMKELTKLEKQNITPTQTHINSIISTPIRFKPKKIKVDVHVLSTDKHYTGYVNSAKGYKTYIEVKAEVVIDNKKRAIDVKLDFPKNNKSNIQSGGRRKIQIDNINDDINSLSSSFEEYSISTTELCD
jgi:hypothetical protein